MVERRFYVVVTERPTGTAVNTRSKLKEIRAARRAVLDTIRGGQSLLQKGVETSEELAYLA